MNIFLMKKLIMYYKVIKEVLNINVYHQVFIVKDLLLKN